LNEAELSPGLRRANLVVEGLDVRAAIGKALQIGPCQIRVIAELRPCRLMDDAAPGLQTALDPECRGGVYGRVMQGGLLEVGAAVEIMEIREPAQVDLPLGGQQ
jgi:MOSC domain-containing protein YiiM